MVFIIRNDFYNVKYYCCIVPSTSVLTEPEKTPQLNMVYRTKFRVNSNDLILDEKLSRICIFHVMRYACVRYIHNREDMKYSLGINSTNKLLTYIIFCNLF